MTREISPFLPSGNAYFKEFEMSSLMIRLMGRLTLMIPFGHD
jgi:hypothetical protein